MNIFEEATKLGNQRYNREKLLAITSELIARFRLPCAQDKTKMRGACRHLADALDRSSGSTLQQRWNDFEKKIWTRWNAGIGRPCSLWTWGARVLVPARMIVPSIEWLHDVRVNQWIVRLPKSIHSFSSIACSWELSRVSPGREPGTGMKPSVMAFAFFLCVVTTVCVRKVHRHWADAFSPLT